MPEILAIIVIAALTVLAWKDRAQIRDDWTALLQELGL